MNEELVEYLRRYLADPEEIEPNNIVVQLNPTPTEPEPE